MAAAHTLPPATTAPTLRRRTLLCGALAALTGLPLRTSIAQRRQATPQPEAHPVPAALLDPGADHPERALALYNPQTGEGVQTVYWVRGHYLEPALQAFTYLLRDTRVNAVMPIDPALLDLLSAVQTQLETDAPLYILSGYRAPATNARLRRVNRRAARQSLHMAGKAVDIRLPGRPAAQVRRAAAALQVGGVGYYPTAQFVHVDTGRVRFW